MLFMKFLKIYGLVLFFFWIYFLIVVEGKHFEKRGIMDNINNGIKYAGQMMGITTAADVANLVSKAFTQQSGPSKQFDPSLLFQSLHKYQDSEGYKGHFSFINSVEIIGRLLKTIGFDAGKLGALAINALLLLAQLVGNSFKKRPFPVSGLKSSQDNLNYDTSQHDEDEPFYDDPADARSERENMPENTPIDWILKNPPEGLFMFINQITDVTLPNKLVEVVRKIETQSDKGGCIKLFMCKSAPFIWGMQKSVVNGLNEEPSDSHIRKVKTQQSILFENFPSVDEYRQRDNLCEQRFAQFCNRNNL